MDRDEILKKVDTAFLKRKTGVSMDERMSRLYAIKGYGLEQGRVLRFLLKEGAPDIPGIIADRLGISKSQMTGIVDSFEKIGCLKRIRDEKDRRVQHLALTDEGKRAARELEDYCQSFHITVMEYIDSKDLAVYFKVRKQIENEMLRQLSIYGQTGHFEKKEKIE